MIDKKDLLGLLVAAINHEPAAAPALSDAFEEAGFQQEGQLAKKLFGLKYFVEGRLANAREMLANLDEDFGEDHEEIAREESAIECYEEVLRLIGAKP